MKTKQCTRRTKSWGEGREGVGSKPATHKSPSGLHPTGGPLAARVGALTRVIRTMTSSKGGLRNPEMSKWKLCFYTQDNTLPTPPRRVGLWQALFLGKASG